MSAITKSFRRRHRWFEDVIAIITAALFISLGTTLVKSAGLATGGVVGIAFLLHYGMGWSFGLLFFALNAPFYWLGLKDRGWTFIAKTVAAVALTAFLSELVPRLAIVSSQAPAYAAIMGGTLCGVGTLALFRHNSSFGGFGVLALRVQKTRGWPAGHVLLAIDLCILVVALSMLSFERTFWSVVAAVAMNVTVALNHRSDRYLGS